MPEALAKLPKETYPIALSPVDANYLDHEDDFLPGVVREKLWEIFVEIGRAWENVPNDSAGLRSSWLEFIEAKVTRSPSYAGEYANAVSVMHELVGVLGREWAYQQLFFNSGVSPKDPPVTRLAHLKRYVVDEFIAVQITASGFRGFADSIFSPNRPLNYAGFVRGSRYNERPSARLYTRQQPAGTAEVE
jgi:hypothetical protein